MKTSLFLFPLPVFDEPPSSDIIVQTLQACGFMGGVIEDVRYSTGPAFFHHITFAGCSPHLLMERPSEGGWDFCHISLQRESPPAPLHVAPNRGRPRCPACRSNVPHWKQRLPEWKEDSSIMLACETCGHKAMLADLDWRQYGFGASFSVEIHQVYPGEAVPGERLLAMLEGRTGRQWRYAWAESAD